MGWDGLGWDGLGWVGLGEVGLGWVGLGWVGLGWVGLGLVGGWVGGVWVDRCCDAQNVVVVHTIRKTRLLCIVPQKARSQQQVTAIDILYLSVVHALVLLHILLYSVSLPWIIQCEYWVFVRPPAPARGHRLVCPLRNEWTPRRRMLSARFVPVKYLDR